MTQYDRAVEKQRLRLEMEEWAKGVQHVHSHGISSMWYDDRPEDTAGGKVVTDILYNDGLVKRTLESGEVILMGTPLTGEQLVKEFEKKC
jgi:phage terminase large subunit-like protein